MLGAVGMVSVGKGNGNNGGVGVVVGAGVRVVVDCGIAGIEVCCLDGLVFTNTSQATMPMTTATAKPASAHNQGRWPRGGSGG